MDEILQLAQKIIEEKEQTLKKDKAHIEDFKLQIKLSKQLDQTSHYHMETNDEDYLLIPFE
ncbi:transcriptional regulator, partial [Streptococcus pyogenes]